MDHPQFTTRVLTAEESEAFVRKLNLALANTNLTTAVLRVISESGLGLFVATPVDE